MRLIIGTRPTRPVPKSTIEPGSGVVVTGVKLRLSNTKASLTLAVTVTDEKAVASLNPVNDAGEE